MTSVLLATFLLVGCEGPAAPELEPDGLLVLAEAKGGAEKGRKSKKEDSGSEPAPSYAWYALTVPDDADPLWRFGMDGDLVLLESDPTVAGWGTDYWGYWSEPFTLANGTVTYVNGLTETTYLFESSGEAFDVSKEVVVRSYLGGASSVTRSHVGTFEPTP